MHTVMSHMTCSLVLQLNDVLHCSIAVVDVHCFDLEIETGGEGGRERGRGGGGGGEGVEKSASYDHKS